MSLLVEPAPLIDAPEGYIPFGRSEINQSIPSRIYAQVTRAPNHLAVTGPGGELSYADLHQQSNQIANALLRVIDDCPQPIGLLIGQQTRLISAMLGVLKAGCSYVPLDPATSKTELKKSLADAQPKVLCISREMRQLADSLKRQSRIVVVEDALKVESDDDPAVSPLPEDTAYIYYTSGTTGKAKGVFDSHRNVLHNVMRYTNSLGIVPSDRLTLLQSCGFSGAVSNVFSALCNGATLVMFDLRRHGFAAVSEAIEQHEITIYHSVPTIFSRLLTLRGRGWNQVRVVRLEGDQMRHADAELFRRHFPPSCALINGLGATETGLTHQYVVPRSTESSPTVPVGYATCDVSVVLLDKQGRAVPPGAVGEIIISSPYLACGYWNRPDLTASRFDDRGPTESRAYRSGDLGRFRGDGALELVGRSGGQVRLNGREIDLHRIETALTALPGVNDAIVAKIPSEGTHSQLVGYLVCESKMPAIDYVRDALASAGIPSWSLPAQLMELETLPLDANGKVRRSDLPAPQAPVRMPVLLARTNTELRVAKVYASVLGLDPIGIQENFYSMGGDSLMAVDAIVQLEREFESKLPQSLFLSHPTIETLASALDRGIRPTELIPLRSDGTLTPVFCVHGSNGHLFRLQCLAARFGPDRPFWGLQAAGLEDDHALHRSIHDMAAAYVKHVRWAAPAGPYLVMGCCIGAWVAIEMARQLRRSGHAVPLVVLLDTVPPRRTYDTNSWFRRNLQRAVGPGGLSYLLTAFGKSLGQWRQRFKAGLWALHVSKGMPLPRSLRGVAQAIDQSFQAYRPIPYDGPVLALSSSSGAEIESAEWRSVLQGELAIRTLDATEEALYREPEVSILAATLHKALAEAEARHQRKTPSVERQRRTVG